MLPFFLFILLLLTEATNFSQIVEEHNFLSMFPEKSHLAECLNKSLLNASKNDKLIPRIIWLAVTYAHDELPGHIKSLFHRNPGWLINVVGNTEKDQFMNIVFNNTRIQWAYNIINPALGAAKADVWRYAILWCYGGFYIDYDSDMRTLLDNIVQSTDSLILAQDGTDFQDYFRQDFKLSNNATFQKLATNNATFQKLAITNVSYISGYNKYDGTPQFFGNRFLLNWAIFVAPQNLAFHRTLENIVYILHAEYMRLSVVEMTNAMPRFKLLLFCTGFPMTTSIRELLVEGAEGFSPRICSGDFRQYGGKCKAISTTHDPEHYRNVYKKKNTEILRNYTKLNLPNILKGGL